MTVVSRTTTTVHVVILNYNGWGDTIECLESVLKSDYRGFQVIVLDNGSPDSSMERIKAWAEGGLGLYVAPGHPLRKLSCPPVSKPVDFVSFTREDIEGRRAGLPDSAVVLVQTGENLGFAGANNIALRWVMRERPGSYVWLLNPDMTVEPETLSRLVDFARGDKRNIFGCRLNDYSAPSKTICYGGAKINQYTGTVRYIDDLADIGALDYISGGSFFTCVDNFVKFGLLPEEYFLYWEETDWCAKAKGMGAGFKVCANAVCYDKGSSSVGAGYLHEYYYTRNALKFFRKYKPRQIKYILAASLLRIGKKAFERRFANVRAILDALAAGIRNEEKKIRERRA